MRHPKRYCCKCDKENTLVIRQHKRYSMYHCRECGQEVSRIGDGDSRSSTKAVLGGIDGGIAVDKGSGYRQAEKVLAQRNPDVLSDDHRLWLMEERELPTREALEQVFRTLTLRQQEIVSAVCKHGSQVKAAKALNISFQAVSEVLKKVRKKAAEGT